jgi:hypothetical protein
MTIAINILLTLILVFQRKNLIVVPGRGRTIFPK